MKQYEITLRFGDRDFAMIMNWVKEYIIDFQIIETRERPAPRPRSQRSKPKRKIGAYDTLLDIMGDKARYTRPQLEQAFEDRKFARASLGTVLSLAVKRGRAARVEKGVFVLIDPPQAIAAE